MGFLQLFVACFAMLRRGRQLLPATPTFATVTASAHGLRCPRHAVLQLNERKMDSLLSRIPRCVFDVLGF
jgi:hypothetical protein